MKLEDKIKKKVTIYTDGSIRKSSKGIRKGGYGVVFASGKKIRYYRFPILGLSSSYIEIYAIISTMEILLKDGYQDHSIIINTDFLPIKDGSHGRINYWERTRNGNYKMRSFWLKFRELYRQFDDLTIRWISRNDGDSFNEVADELASEGSELPVLCEYKDISYSELSSLDSLSSKGKKILFVSGEKYYGGYHYIKDVLDALVDEDTLIVTTNSPGAEGFAEFYCQLNGVPLVRVLTDSSDQRKELLDNISELSSIDDSIFFTSKKKDLKGFTIKPYEKV